MPQALALLLRFPATLPSWPARFRTSRLIPSFLTIIK
jgi:hypothetical protein